LRVSTTTTFATTSYQGELRENNAPYSGNVDVEFGFFDSIAGGGELQTIAAQTLPTESGRFTCFLNLDPRVFNGREVYLEPRVRRTGSGQAFTRLSPRQRVFASPHALIAHEAQLSQLAQSTPWSGLTGVPAGFADGIDNERALGGDGVSASVSRSDHTHTSIAAFLAGGPVALQATFDGDIGIGTTTPAVRLHVREGISGATPSSSSSAAFERSSTNYVQILSPDANERGLVFGSPSSGFTGGVYYTNAGGMNFRTGGNVGRMFIDPSGLVGVGLSPTTNRLEVSGNASKSTAGSWLANSDSRIKQNVRPVMDALGTLDKVELVSFEYTPSYRFTHDGIDERRYLNVIAQQFATVFPDWVKTSGERLPDGSQILQVDTYPLTIYSAAAVQELNAKIKTLEARVRFQDAKLVEQEARLRALEAAVGAAVKATGTGSK